MLQHAAALGGMDDLPLDVMQLVLTQVNAHLQLNSNADTVSHLKTWCTLASVCKRWVP